MTPDEKKLAIKKVLDAAAAEIVAVIPPGLEMSLAIAGLGDAAIWARRGIDRERIECEA